MSPGLTKWSNDDCDDSDDDGDDNDDDDDEDDTLKAGIPVLGFNDRALRGLDFRSH